jgi:cytochrome c556
LRSFDSEWTRPGGAPGKAAEDKMRTKALALTALTLAITTAAAAAPAEDLRNAIDLPPDVRTQFLDHMRTHMNALDDVIRQLAQGKIRAAGATAQSEMAIGQGLGFGRYMPQEFRELGFSYHQAAGDFARLANDVPEPPDAAGWTKIAGGLAKITTQCNSCHAAFRVK